MLYYDFTENLIGLQEIILKEIKKSDNSIHIYGKLERKVHICPKCGNQTENIHDYREDADSEKYQYILTDSVNKVVIVINTFNKVLSKFGIQHQLILPRATPWHNVKVERSHRNDQRYFYELH